MVSEPDEAGGGPGETPAQRSFLYEEVYRQIVRLIERQEFLKGAKLPTEMELAERFGVSRPIVRRALDLLREADYVTTRKGSGTVVIRGPAQTGPQFQPLATIADLQQFYEFRVGLEGQTAFTAAARRSEQDLEALAAAIGRTEAVLEQGERRLATDLNFDFHRAVALASGNRFSVATLQALPNFVGDVPLKQVFVSVGNESYAWQAHAEHKAIFEAIRNRDGQLARSLMVDHITAAMRFVFERTKV